MKTVYYVRHGESETNVTGIVAGQTQNPPLTKHGREQAKKVGQKLKSKRIELIVTSPLKRAVETATIIAKEIGHDPRAIVQNPLFLERSLGIYEGGPGTIYGADLASNKVHESVETEARLYERIKRGFEWLGTRQEGIVLLVGHGGASRAVRAIAENIHHSHMHRLEEFDNAAIYTFKL